MFSIVSKMTGESGSDSTFGDRSKINSASVNKHNRISGRTKYLIIIQCLICLSIIVVRANGQVVQVSGSVILQGGTNYANVAVTFERLAPTPLSYTYYTDASGNYIAPIENGIYAVTFSKNGFLPFLLNNQILYSNTVLPTATLYPRSTIIRVPEQVPTIQYAIDQAFTGDTILISRGVYAENLSITGKIIVITSNFLFTSDTSDISQTIIDGGGLGRVIDMQGVSSGNFQLVGLTIRNGLLTYWDNGGGLNCINSNPTLRNLVFENNTARGGGISLDHSSPQILNCLFRNNNGTHFGGAIYMQESCSPYIESSQFYNNTASSGAAIYCGPLATPHINRCIISNNRTASDDVGGGGGISLEFSSPGIVENSLISNNFAGYGGGGIICYGSDAIIRNNTIVNNQSARGSGISMIVNANPVITNCIIAYNTGGGSGIENDPAYPGAPLIRNCDVYHNPGGNFFQCGSFVGMNVTLNANHDSCDAYSNIQSNPFFVNIVADFTLGFRSPCIDAGNNEYVMTQTDLAGNPRILDGDWNETAIVDMGCYEKDIITGIDKDHLRGIDPDVTLYPNPVIEKLSFRLTDGKMVSKVEVFNSFGTRVIIAEPDSNEGSISLSANPPGVYLVKLTTESRIITRLVIR